MTAPDTASSDAPSSTGEGSARNSGVSNDAQERERIDSNTGDGSGVSPRAEPARASGRGKVALQRLVSAASHVKKAKPVFDALSAPIVAAAFYFFVDQYTRFKNIVEFDPDEGNNVIKALLLSRGHRFLDDIWSDQPPLFSHLLRAVFEVTSWKTVNARLLVVFFAAVVVAVVYDLLRRRYGHGVALAGAGLLITTKLYVPLAVSVMIGLPAIALSAVGVWALTRWGDTSHRVYLVVSAILFALSVGTKMFTAFLPPLCGVVLLVWSFRRHGKHGLKHVGIDVGLWGGAFLIASAACLWPVLTADDPLAVYRAHQIARGNAAIAGLTGQLMVPKFFEDDLAVFLLAMFGVFVAGRRKEPTAILMSVWVVVASVVLYRHQPVWTHHRLLVTIPAAYLAATAIGEFTIAMRQGSQRWSWTKPSIPAGLLPPFALLLVLFASPDRTKEILKPPGWSVDDRDIELLDRLAPYREKTRYMLTARQMYAFRLGMEVPPSLAVTSLKRFRTGLMNSQTIIDALGEYEPGIVVITTRWSRPVRNKVRRALEQQYVRIFEDHRNHKVEVFVRREIVIPADTMTEG